MGTPWGAVQHTERWERGISFVGTAGHGGVRVSRKYASEHLSDVAIAHAIFWNDGYLYYEEDCDWAIPVFELPHLWDQTFQWMKDADTEEKRRAYLVDSLKFWNVRYAIRKGLIQEGDNFYCCNYENSVSGKGKLGRVDGKWVCEVCGEVIA